MLPKNQPDILQLIQKIGLIFLSKNQPYILELVQNRHDILLLNISIWFLVENQPIKSMHNFETNNTP